MNKLTALQFVPQRDHVLGDAKVSPPREDVSTLRGLSGQVRKEGCALLNHSVQLALPAAHHAHARSSRGIFVRDRPSDAARRTENKDALPERRKLPRAAVPAAQEPVRNEKRGEAAEDKGIACSCGLHGED